MPAQAGFLFPMSKRKPYSDKFKANCVAMLTALGYPDKIGILPEVSNNTHVPERTLQRWWKAQYSMADDKIVAHQKKDLATMFEELAHKAVKVARDNIEAEDSKSAATVAGIAVDKMRLLRGLPTEIIDIAPQLTQLMELMKQFNHNPQDVFAKMIERYEDASTTIH